MLRTILLHTDCTRYIDLLTDIFITQRTPFRLLGVSELPLHTNFKIFGTFRVSQSSHLKIATFCKLKPSFYVV